MRKLVLSGLVLGMGGIAAPAALAQGLAPAPGMARPPMMQPAPQMRHGGQWGQRVNGRWSAGWNAPGGWNAYRRPVAGYTLPAYWINPSYYIADYRSFGLPAPAQGYGWSRYYDDAVLTDRYGRVVDARYGYDWDRFGGYDEAYAPPPPYGAPPPPRQGHGNAVGGAIAGGVIGGVAGNVIAGRGNRTGGTILGAGIGAIAGAAIGDGADRRHRRDRTVPPPQPAPLPYGYPAPAPYAGYDGVSAGGPATYDGQWVGTWYGADGTAYSGTYQGQYDGTAEGGYAQGGYAQGGYAQGGYVQQGYAYPAPAYGYGYGYSSYGYAEQLEYAAPIVETVTITTEETRYVAAARRTVRRAAPRRPRARIVRCTCSCGC